MRHRWLKPARPLSSAGLNLGVTGSLFSRQREGGGGGGNPTPWKLRPDFPACVEVLPTPPELPLGARLLGPTAGRRDWGEASAPCSVVSPGYVRVPIAASHVQRRPASLIALLNVGAVFDQQLHTFQVSRQDGFMQSSQAWQGGKAGSKL